MSQFRQHIGKLLLFSFILFFISFLVRSVKIETFMDFNSFQRYFQTIQYKNQASENYQAWLGYIYSNPSTSAELLNDFKKRAFQPSCLFRRDWSSRIPTGLNRPNPPQTKELANMAYLNTLKCLAKTNSQCTFVLDDFRKRFFEPGCEFRNPPLADYVANYHFK
jgi:hypothetical protein